MRNGLCMMMCDTPGGRLFTYLEWESKKKAIEIEVYATDPVVVPVTLGKEVKTLVLSRKQIMLLYGTGPEWTKFVDDLNTRCQQPRVPFMVEDCRSILCLGQKNSTGSGLC